MLPLFQKQTLWKLLPMLLYLLLLCTTSASSLAVKECRGNHEPPMADAPRFVSVEVDPLPAVAFKARFFEILNESLPLQDLFESGGRLTPEDQAAGTFYLTVSTALSRGDRESAWDAHLASKFVRCDPVAPRTVQRVMVNAVAKILRMEGLLNLHRSIVLAEDFASALQRGSEDWVDQRYPRSKVVAQILGFQTFLDSQGLLTGEKSRKIAIHLGDEWMYQTINCSDKAHSTPENQKRPTSAKPSMTPNPELAVSIKSCSEVAPGVALFASVAAQSVLSSYPVAQAFDLSELHPLELARASFYTFQHLFIAAGAPQTAAALADFASRVVARLEGLSLPRTIRAMSRFVGKYVHSRGVLRLDNAREMAQGYARAVGDTAALVLDKAVPRSKVAALLFGTVRFIADRTDFGAEDGKRLAFFYGNEWFCEGLSKATAIAA